MSQFEEKGFWTDHGMNERQVLNYPDMTSATHHCYLETRFSIIALSFKEYSSTWPIYFRNDDKQVLLRYGAQRRGSASRNIGGTHYEIAKQRHLKLNNDVKLFSKDYWFTHFWLTNWINHQNNHTDLESDILLISLDCLVCTDEETRGEYKPP